MLTRPPDGSGTAHTAEARAAIGFSLGRYAAGGFVVILLIAAVAVLLVGRVLDAERQSRDAVNTSHDSIELLQNVFSSLQDAETGARGFVITNDPAFLAPYENAESRFGDQLTALEGNLQDAEALELLRSLVPLIDEQRDYYRGLIALRQQSGFAAAADVIGQQVSKRRMDSIRAQVESLDTRLDAILQQRLAANIAGAERSERVVRVLIIVGVLLVLLIGWRLLSDIRRRNEAELDLRVSNAVIAATMNSIPQGISVFDGDLKLIAWNPQFAALRGIDAQEVRLGMSFSDVVRLGAQLEDVSVAAGTVPIAIDRREVFDRVPHVKELKRADGLMLEVRGQLREDGHYILTYTDITQLKRSELAYRDQATRLASILDAAVDAIITINESGSIESWSKGAERLFGYRAEEVIRRNVSILMPAPHAAGHDGYLSHYMTTGVKRIIGIRREMEGLHQDGHVIPIDLGVSEMSIGGRRLFIGVVRDITERRAVERLKNEFVSTVSHELRTPLTSISGALGLLAGNVAGAMTPKAKRLVDIAQANSARLIRLINDILDLEKAEAGRLDLVLENQLLLPVVMSALEAARGFADSRGVVLQMAPESVDGLVQIDRDRLIQVLSNLMSNAIKFSPDKGVVKVRVERDARMLRILVIDQGPGIPDSFRARIFQKFAQADSSDSRARGGTGLGLSIAQTLTERLGGVIGYTSTEGAGATFHVSLPESVDAGQAQLDAPVPAPGSRILVCEDDPDIAAVLVELLGSAGLQPVVAPSAQAARQLLREHAFDVALIDLNLPDADGLELIASLRSDSAAQSLPMIVMTARHEQGSAALLQSLQLVDWLAKPIDSVRLLSSIQVALRGTDSNRYSVLHVEDDDSLVEMLQTKLASEADVTVARSLAEARGCLTGGGFDLVILDMGLKDGSGLELLPLLRGENASAPPVVLYSATQASRDVAAQVEAALVKSRDSIEQLLFTVRRLARRHANKNRAGGG
ncbi:MAG: response regulator [Steroidobacteraceae bacterium]